MTPVPISPAAPRVAPTWLARYRAVRAQSQALCAPLLPEDTVVQPMLDVSPPKWHLAHTTWFWETFLLKEYAPGYQLFHPEYAYLFNSYYNSLGSRVNRADRGTLSRPALADVLAYRAHVDAALAKLLTERRDLPPVFFELLELGLQHEQQHQELLATDIKYILSTSPLAPAYIGDELSELRVRSEELRVEPTVTPESTPNSSLLTLNSKEASWLPMPGGVHRIGFRESGFCFDNELAAHDVLLAPFELQNRLVTNAEYQTFIEAGGYRDFRYWMGEGWDLAQAQAGKPPSTGCGTPMAGTASRTTACRRCCPKRRSPTSAFTRPMPTPTGPGRACPPRPNGRRPPATSGPPPAPAPGSKATISTRSPARRCRPCPVPPAAGRLLGVDLFGLPRLPRLHPRRWRAGRVQRQVHGEPAGAARRLLRHARKPHPR
jgi:hypothetical protein